MENIKIYENIIEYILYKRDRNKLKDWGHIYGYTKPYSYSKWNNSLNIEYYSKYINNTSNINDSFINMINNWYNGNFERKYLENYNFKDSYLYNFIYAISYDKYNEKKYYFNFSEKIDKKGLIYLINSYKLNKNYLFTNIGLASYYQHNKNFDLSYKFYINSLSLDPNNPYVLANFSILVSSLGGFDNLLKSEKIMFNVFKMLPNIPWVNAYYGESLNRVGNYIYALEYFEKYEYLTEGGHRTFEPFLRKAESYIGLGDFSKAEIELKKESKYYFGEGYRFIYEDLFRVVNKILH